MEGQEIINYGNTGFINRGSKKKMERAELNVPNLKALNGLPVD